MSKTPQFDKALDAILKDLAPHGRKCRQCQQPFQVEKEDIGFYRMLRVPPPTLCPLCRQKRRLGQLMRVPKFFKKRCAVPGHAEDVVTVFPPASPHRVYDLPSWYSDERDTAALGRAYDPSRGFLEQFRDLFFAAPHAALERDVTAVNCDYSVGGRWGKNDYYCGGAYKSEDCAYGTDVRFSRACIDCAGVWHSEFCYGSVDSDHCNRCIAVVGCAQCLDSAFLYDCKNCSHCFLSANLRNRSYVFENEQLSKEAYRARVQSLNLGDRVVFQEYTSRFGNLYRRAIHRSVVTTNTHRSIGDRLTDCKDCFWTFDGSGGENLRYVNGFINVRDVMDTTYTGESTGRAYETVIGLGSDIYFSLYLRTSLSVEYSTECQNCRHCFGCVGLRDKQFHILNRAYPEEEYWRVVDGIKTRMLADGEYGELFPLRMGLFPYQSSSGQKWYPLDEAAAAGQGIPWYPEPESHISPEAHLRDPRRDVPGDIRDVDDDILDGAIVCEVTKRPFRITPSELAFYRRMGLPVPTKHPWQRLMERGAFEHAMWLSPFTCPQCGVQSFSVYDSAQQKELTVRCEQCYLKEVV